MVQRGDGAGLALEAIAELLRGDFDGHVASQPRIVRLVHLAHAARADKREDFVRPEFVAWLELHLGAELSLADQGALSRS